jgi:hypothetical protein
MKKAPKTSFGPFSSFWAMFLGDASIVGIWTYIPKCIQKEIILNNFGSGFSFTKSGKFKTLIRNDNR